MEAKERCIMKLEQDLAGVKQFLAGKRYFPNSLEENEEEEEAKEPNGHEVGGESGKETRVFVSVALVTRARSVYVFFRVFVVCFCLCWHRLSR